MKVTIAALVACLMVSASTAGAEERPDVDKLRNELRERDREIADLESQLKALQRSVEMVKKRNEQLVTELGTMTKEVVSIKKGKTQTGQSGTLKAVIKQVEGDAGIMLLSVDKDAGLSEGQELELARNQSARNYIGIIRVLRVNDNGVVVQATDGIDKVLRSGESVFLKPTGRR
jgi:hypothetical protein